MTHINKSYLRVCTHSSNLSMIPFQLFNLFEKYENGPARLQKAIWTDLFISLFAAGDARHGAEELTNSRFRIAFSQV